jgi:hypothetical protein
MSNPIHEKSIFEVIGDHFSQVSKPRPGESRILHLIYGILEAFPIFGWIGAACERSFRASQVQKDTGLGNEVDRVASIEAVQTIVKPIGQGLEEPFLPKTFRQSEAEFSEITKYIKGGVGSGQGVVTSYICNYHPKINTSVPETLGAMVKEFAALEVADDDFTKIIPPKIIEILYMISNIKRQNLYEIDSPNFRAIISMEEKAKDKLFTQIFMNLSELPESKRKILIAILREESENVIEKSKFNKDGSPKDNGNSPEDYDSEYNAYRLVIAAKERMETTLTPAPSATVIDEVAIARVFNCLQK